MLIGGERVGSGSGKTYEVRNPATGELVQNVPLGNADDVEQAVQAAERAFGEWAETSAEDRGVALANACELIKEHAGDIAQLLTAEQGKTLFEANLEIHHLVHGLEFYAGLASKVRGSHVPLPQKGAYGLVIRQPIGVCGAIVPWNFPLTLMGTKVGPALAAGNAIIVKPASTTSPPPQRWRTPAATLTAARCAWASNGCLSTSRCTSRSSASCAPFSRRKPSGRAPKSPAAWVRCTSPISARRSRSRWRTRA